MRMQVFSHLEQHPEAQRAVSGSDSTASQKSHAKVALALLKKKARF